MLFAKGLVCAVLLVQQPTLLSWEEVGPTPPGWCPQGLAAADGGLLLCAYRGSQESSAVFEVRTRDGSVDFKKLFDLPAEARHTSGLAEIPGRPDRLFAVSYRSRWIYLLDLPGSCRAGQAVVVAACDSGMNGPSACCVVRLANGQRLLMVSEFQLLKPGRNTLFEFHPGSSGTVGPGSIDPFITRYELASPFANRGQAQGAKFYDGHVYETGNRLGSPSYLVRYRLEDALVAGRIPAGQDRGAESVEHFRSSISLIEDIAFFRGFLWVTDEGQRRLYRTPAPLTTDRTILRSRMP
jgi:hypothetical protein